MLANARRASIALITTSLAFAACDGCSEKPEEIDAAPAPIVEPDAPSVDPLEEAREGAEERGEEVGVHVSDMAALVGAAIEASQTETTVASATRPSGGAAKAPDYKGRIDAKGAERAFRKYDGAMRKCYERSLKRRPGLDGKVSLTVVVGDDGQVRSASARDVSLGEGAVGQCMRNLAKRIKFPPPTGGQARLAKTYTFTPQL